MKFKKKKPKCTFSSFGIVLNLHNRIKAHNPRCDANCSKAILGRCLPFRCGTHSQSKPTALFSSACLQGETKMKQRLINNLH